MSASRKYATAPPYERDFTKRLGRNVRFVRFTPPLSDYYAKGNAFSAFAEAVAAGRRPRSATGSGSAGRLHGRYYTTLLYWCAAGFSKGASQIIGETCLTIGGFDLVDWFDLT